MRVAVPAKSSFWEHEQRSSGIEIVLTSKGFRTIGHGDIRRVQLADLMSNAPHISFAEREALFSGALLRVTNDFEAFVQKADEGKLKERLGVFAVILCCWPCVLGGLAKEMMYGDDD